MLHSRITERLRRLTGGARHLALEILGSFPSRTLRTAGLRAWGARIDPSATVYKWKEIRNPREIIIGPGSIIGSRAILDGRLGITVGRNVNLSSEVAIWSLQHDHGDRMFGTSGGRVTIGDRAWVSFRATLLPGVTIGEGAVVAAGAVVTKDVADYEIVAGIPAKRVGTRSRDLVYDWSTKRGQGVWFI